MRKLSEYKGDEALELLADLVDPAIEIMADADIAQMLKSGRYIGAVKPILKAHKQAVLQILALLNGKTVEEYKKEVNLFTIPKALLELLNDPDLMSLFTSAEQTEGVTSSGSASENTEE